MSSTKSQKQLNEDLCTASRRGDVSEVNTLLSEGADVNHHDTTPGYDNETPLHISAQLGHEDVVKLLLEQTAIIVVDARDENGYTPLHCSAVGGIPEVAKLLLDAGASVSSVDDHGDSVLHFAAYYGQLDIVKLLVLKGANLSLCNENGDSALHEAAVWEHLDIVKFLLEQGADLSLRNKSGQTALDRAREENKHEVVKYLEEVEGHSSTTTEHTTTSLQSPDTQSRIETSVRMMREKGSLNLRTLHLILHGLPAAGKTCAKLRLTGQELTSRKPAERRNGTIFYPPDDGACSTPVAEEITRARLPASDTALTRDADDLPWYLLQSLDEEMVGLVEKIAKLPPETKTNKKSITTVTPVPSSSQAISQPAEPVGKAFQEMITSAFNKAPHNTLQDILQETLIYLIDSGGQPQFQELLPILVSGPSVFLLTFSLAVPLDAVYEVHFIDKDGKREDYPTNMRVRDVLTQSLASIRCTCSYQTNGGERVEVKPRVIFMATMRSLMSDEEIAAIDKQLKSLVEPFSDLIVYKGSGVLFPVDSFTGEGIPALRAAVRHIANDKITKVTGGVSYTSPMCEVKLPTTAVALELLLRNQEKGIISLDQCKQLAIDCNIDPETELPNILWLLHHFTGSIRYYPEDTTLQQYVVTRPQRLYDVPSTLLTHTFAFKKEGEPDYVPKKKIWTRGVFTMETLRKLWGQDQDLTPDLTASFLIHLNIIVQMHDEESEEEPFFMPSALVCAPDDYFIDVKVSVDSTLVCFNGGYSPKGVFSSVIAYLPKEREENESVDLKWCLPSTVGSLCCNQATLVVSVNEEFDLLVRFTLHLKFIEIAVNSECEEDLVSSAQLQLGCEAVLHDVSRAVQVVSQRLHYNSNATLKDGLFFPCYCSNDPSTHAAKYLPPRKKGKCHGRSSQPDQLWMQKWIKGTSSVVEQSQPSTAPPPQGACSNMVEQLRSVSDSMAEENHTATAAAVRGDISRTLTENDLCDVLPVICDLSDWKDLGLQLGLLYTTLTDIETYRRGKPSECRIDLLSAWLQRQDNVKKKGVPSWSMLRAALQSMGEHETANRISIAERPTTDLSPPVVSIASGTVAPILPSADPLNKSPKRRELLHKIASRALDKWKRIGRELELEQHQLNTITHQDAFECYSEVFDLWQRKADPPFTWATILDALRSPFVRENALAQEIEDWLLRTATCT